MTTAAPGSNLPERDWLIPQDEQQGLRRYVETIRERIWLIVAVVIITTGFALLYVSVATKTYEAQADLFVNCARSDDPALEGLPVIRCTSDPTRDVETAAQLVTTIEVARRVKRVTGSEKSADSLLDAVSAEPVAQSNIVAVTATEESPRAAADLANAFATQAIENSSDRLRASIEAILPDLRNAAERQSSLVLADQVGTLELLLRSGDPTLDLITRAEPDSTPISPRPVLSVVGGIFAGVILGVLAAFAFQVLDPRLRREEQLRRLYRLPILARIPKESGRSLTTAPLGPAAISPVVAEAYRTLRGTISASHRGSDSRVLLVTGSSPSEGKTTTGLNLAASFAATGKRVILVEADLRRPAIGRALSLSPRRGVVSVLTQSMELEDAVINAEDYGLPNLDLLLADYEGGLISELFTLPTAFEMIERAREIADYVIIDSPPLTDVADSLPLARMADDVLIVVRPGTTRINKLAQLGELFSESGIRPIGFAVVGTARPTRGESRYYADKRETFAIPGSGQAGETGG